MELKEIVQRDINLPRDTNECLFVIEQYVKIRKDVDVKAWIDTRYGDIMTFRKLSLLSQMYEVAETWLRQYYDDGN